MSENEKNYSEEKRNININSNSPEIMTNNIYTPAFLREQIGKLVRVEFLIGASYILLQSIESNTLLYCDIYSIKFVTISNPSNANRNLYNPYFY